MKRKLCLFVIGIMLMSSMTVFAETKTFDFYIEYTGGDSTYPSTAQKADNEQKAYLTPTYMYGTGRVWMSIRKASDHKQQTVDVGVELHEVDRTKTLGYYITGYPVHQYYLSANDNEWEISSGEVVVQGRYTP